MKITKEILIAARAKIAQPECWTQGRQARTQIGIGTDARDARAVCWCGFGAVWFVVGYDYYNSTVTNAENALNDQTPQKHFPTWQDAKGRTHAEVLAMFDKAIEAQP